MSPAGSSADGVFRSTLTGGNKKACRVCRSEQVPCRGVNALLGKMSETNWETKQFHAKLMVYICL